MKKAFLTHLNSFEDDHYHPLDEYLRLNLAKYGLKNLKSTLLFMNSTGLISFLNDGHLTWGTVLNVSQQDTILSTVDVMLQARITQKGRSIITAIEKESREQALNKKQQLNRVNERRLR